MMVLFYLLSGGTLFQEKATIYLYVPDSTGIGNGSLVTVDGIEIGKVDGVALSGDTRPDRIVKITISVSSTFLRTIPSDSYAELSSENIIGDRFVDITSGTSRTPIRPNGVIRYKETGDMLKRLDLSQFHKQLDAVDQQITDIEQGRGPVGQLVRGTGMYDEWRKLLREAQAGVHTIAAQNGPLGSVVYTDQEYEAVRKLVRNLDESLARLESGQGDLGQLLRDDARYQQLTASFVGLRGSIDAIKGGAWLQSDADYRSWSQGLAGLIRSVDEFSASPEMTTAQVYESLHGMSRELEKNLRDFRLNPKKFLRMKLF